MSRKYPISEIFTSPQGEGLYAGALMTFVRFAGCTVGHKATDAEKEKFLMLEDPESKRKNLPVMANYVPYRETCTLYDGRQFCCDTDFRPKQFLTSEEILAQVPEGVDRICITGGEPLMHDLSEFIELIFRTNKDAHIETSGSVSIQKSIPTFTALNLINESVMGFIWLTVSPKLGVLPEMVGVANEVKLLIDENFDEAKLPGEIAEHKLVWIQPINFEHSVNVTNLQQCISLQQKHKHWRISNQSHKMWGVR